MVKIKYCKGRRAAYLVSKAELRQYLGSPGICDLCNSNPSSDGYIVPVLHMFLCPFCFEQHSTTDEFYSAADDDFFQEQSIYYESTIPLEEYYESLIPMEGT